MGKLADHPVGRYCGDQMCCWGPAGKRAPVEFASATVHICREGYGKQPALCGANPRVMVHGGPATATCKRCLTCKAGKEWIKSITWPLARRMVRANLKRLGLGGPK